MFVENEEDEAQTVEDLGVENNKPFDFLAFVRRSSECKTHDCSVRLKTLGQMHKRTTVLLFKKKPGYWKEFSEDLNFVLRGLYTALQSSK